MNEKRKWRTASRFRRGAVLLGVVGLAAGAAVMSAGSALAAVGADPGGLSLNPSSGATTLQPTWTTTNGCPAAEQVSAQVSDYTTGGTLISRISPAVSTGLTGSFSGTLDFAMQTLLSTAGIGSGGTVEFVVVCYTGAGATGTGVPADSIFVNVPTGGGTFTTSASPPVAAATSTALTASPNPAAVGATVTLTANVTSGSSFPAGTVQFEANGTNIGTPVAVNTGGVSVPATTTTSFSAAGSENLTAVFVASNTASYAGSTGSFTLGVGTTNAGGTNPVSISVTVPATGTLSVTVATGSVTLATASPATTPDETATGTLNTVTVTDTRNTSPGWSVLGQESTFTETGGSNTIPASSLGWTPTGTTVGGATLGGAVAPSGANTGSTGPGLGTAATLAQALPGFGVGTNTYTANLLLDIPATTPPGAYTGSLTITYASAGP